jgi:formylglycine-generating enzyme
MTNMRLALKNSLAILLLGSMLTACNSSSNSKRGKNSDVTGWKYNDKTMGNFQVMKPKDVKTAPGLVFVQGGTFAMGQNQEDVMADWNNVVKRQTVPSFFIDKTEIANVHYREYLHWLINVFSGDEYEQLLRDARPDSLVWRSELAYNEPYVEYYFKHPTYNYYPVVGVTWKQAQRFCEWRTDRVNEQELMKGPGYLDPKNQIKKTLNGAGQENFNYRAYLLGEYQATPSAKARSKSNPLKDVNDRPRTQVKFEDGILFGEYRLPKEAEWEYAAYGYMNQNPQKKFNPKKRGEEVHSNKQIYPWANDGFDNLRYTKRGAMQGAFLANFKRGNGDYMGVAGGLNDNGVYTVDVMQYAPNGFGLYNMAGNVNEWVLDVYRPITADNNDVSAVRGNVFKSVDFSKEEGSRRDSIGRIIMKNENDSVLRNRRNYQRSYAIDFLDGDSTSGAQYGYGITTLISDKSRVYKGGSWNDMPYWLVPGTRRFMEEDQSTATIGFRCAMDHVGSPEGTKKEMNSGNSFPARRAKR